MTLAAAVACLTFATIVAVALVIIGRGGVRPADPSRPRCGNCGYDLRGRDPSSSPQCPECSHILGGRDGLAARRWLVRPRLSMLGRSVLIASLLAVIGAAAISRYLPEPAVAAPPGGLDMDRMYEALWEPWPDAAKDNLWTRAEDEAPDSLLLDLARSLVKLGRTRHPQIETVEYYVRARIADLLQTSYQGDDDFAAMTELLAQIAPHFEITPRRNPDSPVVLLLWQRSNAVDIVRTTQRLVGVTTVDGLDVPSNPSRDRRFERPRGVALLDVPWPDAHDLALPPGAHDLVVVIESTVERAFTADGEAARAHVGLFDTDGRVGAVWQPTGVSHRHEITMRVEVLGP